MQTEVLSTDRFDVYRAITDKIVAAIEAGAGEFVMPWHRVGPGVGRPTNAASRVRYRGVNVVVLWAEAMAQGYSSGFWATFEQWKKLGASVRRGEHGTTIVFYKPLGPSDTDDDELDGKGARLVARAFRVFNAEQILGWAGPAPVRTSPLELMEQAEAFVASTAAKIRHGGDRACYRPWEDTIDMPERARFVGTTTSSPTEAYYSTVFHELVHWSGATHRLDREFSQRFGSESYAMEELIAELGAAFLCADMEITNEPRPDHAAYLADWLTVLRNDRRAIFTAAQKAREATVYLGALLCDPAKP